MTKKPSEIISVTLNEATFDNITVKPTAVNFIFGNNGTGKSTLANAIYTGETLAWDPQRNPQDYSFHLYDHRFVEENLRSSTQLAGVFTLDKQNIQIEEQLSHAKFILDATRNSLNDAVRQREEKHRALAEQLDRAIEACWQGSEDIRRRFPATQEGKRRNKKAFFDAVATQLPGIEHDLAEMEQLYKVAFDDKARTYPHLSAPKINVPDSELVAKRITSSADTAYAQFVEQLGALGWIEQGHEAYAASADGKCPYCFQQLPEDFEQQLASSVDEAYRQEVAALKEFTRNYQAATTNLLTISKSHELTDLLPGLDLSEYDTQLDLLRMTIEANARTLQTKLRDPSMEAHLEPLDPILEEIDTIVSQANAVIDKHNAVVNDQKSQQALCSQQVWQRLAFDLHRRIYEYQSSKKTLESDIKRSDEVAALASSDVTKLEKAIERLTRQTVNTAQTMKTINKLLHDSGFEGFQLREKPDTPNVYEVVRPNGDIAHRLSEGERNFIAFLYFYFQIQGSLTTTGDTKDKIVIIDDPVSSMDTGALFIVAALVRELVSTTLNNWMPTNASSTREHIKQIFVLTHNAYFFKEASYNRINEFDTVSYFLIQKHDNHSTVIPCVRYRHDMPSIEENYSPVTNAYAALWGEYKEVKNPTILLNVMRRILEHYFLQLCGHDGATLRNYILEKNRHKFIKGRADSPDLTDLRQAESILAYLTHEMTGLGDDTFFIEHTADTETCRNVFQKIFTCMGQEQHYNMMMGTQDNHQTEVVDV